MLLSLTLDKKVMNARCEFKLNKKIDVVGMDLDDGNLTGIKQQLIELIRGREVEIHCVERYATEDEDPNAAPEDLAQVEGTFFDINIPLSEVQFESWELNKDAIFAKTITQLESDKLYISGLWGRDNEQHIGFIKDDL